MLYQGLKSLNKLDKVKEKERLDIIAAEANAKTAILFNLKFEAPFFIQAFLK